MCCAHEWTRTSRSARGPRGDGVPSEGDTLAQEGLEGDTLAQEGLTTEGITLEDPSLRAPRQSRKPNSPCFASGDCASAGKCTLLLGEPAALWPAELVGLATPNDCPQGPCCAGTAWCARGGNCTAGGNSRCLGDAYALVCASLLGTVVRASFGGLRKMGALRLKTGTRTFRTPSHTSRVPWFRLFATRLAFDTFFQRLPPLLPPPPLPLPRSLMVPALRRRFGGGVIAVGGRLGARAVPLAPSSTGLASDLGEAEARWALGEVAEGLRAPSRSALASATA